MISGSLLCVREVPGGRDAGSLAGIYVQLKCRIFSITGRLHIEASQNKEHSYLELLRDKGYSQLDCFVRQNMGPPSYTRIYHGPKAPTCETEEIYSDHHTQSRFLFTSCRAEEYTGWEYPDLPKTASPAGDLRSQWRHCAGGALKLHLADINGLHRHLPFNLDILTISFNFSSE